MFKSEWWKDSYTSLLAKVLLDIQRRLWECCFAAATVSLLPHTSFLSGWGQKKMPSKLCGVPLVMECRV